MTIAKKDLFMDNLWDWGILNGCFSATRTAPTDLDGLIERKGHFLVLETKSPGVPVKRGQQIMFDSMIKSGTHTVIIIWGSRDSPQEMQILYPGGRKSEKKKCNLDDLRNTVSKWFAYADKKGGNEKW